MPRKMRFVYFMPCKSKIFTQNPARRYFQLIRCTQGSEQCVQRGPYLLDSRRLPRACQVTKGARIWSWQEIHENQGSCALCGNSTVYSRDPSAGFSAPLLGF